MTDAAWVLSQLRDELRELQKRRRALLAGIAGMEALERTEASKLEVVSIPGDGLELQWVPTKALMVAEASELGLKPGQWPQVLEITGADDAAIRFQRMEQLHNPEAFDSFQGYRYVAENGVKLDVLND